MPSEFAILARGLGKCHPIYTHPADRLKQLLFGWRRQFYREFWALREVDLEIRRGEVVGIVGRNGAGKSTLLQTVCGTLQPTEGELSVQGRVAALLELGAGFNPDFTGRENVYLNAAILGLDSREVDARIDDILAFADIGDFVDQPVKTYSSGMFVRLAFAVATSVDPDILVIDEALSVGDGAFARKSFDRIMSMKESGKTILFCSHAMYQVEALCNRSIWVDKGRVRMQGAAAEVTAAYNASLSEGTHPTALRQAPAQATVGTGRITRVSASADGAEGTSIAVRSGESNVAISIEFVMDPTLPPPSLAVGIADSNNLTIASATSRNDGVSISMDLGGHGRGTIVFTALPLLKGQYSITSFLLCENAIHVYDQAERSILLKVTQKGLEQGLVTLKHEWIAGTQ